ncbi:MAG: hypothetical protein PHR07_04495 [Acidaminococcaceae bacterium]|nr:hypothetical protein [Acidaminococcaceae bacterium]
MAFKLISRHEPVIEEFYVTDSEAIVYGEALIFSSGRLTKATDATDIACIAQQAVTAGTDQVCKVIIMEPGQIWEAPYSGTADAGFIVGVVGADLDGTATGIDAADITGGAFAVLSKDTTALTVRVMCKLRAFN